MDRDWTHLMPELVQLMSKKITTLPDFIRLRASCKTWRNAVSPPSHHLSPLLPWLTLPRGPDNDQYDNLGPSLSMYDLSESTTHILHLPAIQGKRICGCSHGWLVLEKERNVWLLNPITRDVITLPSLSVQPNIMFPEDIEGAVINSAHRFCIKKAILSSNPRIDSNCLVMALFAGSWITALCKIGNECWTTVFVEDSIWAPEASMVHDIGYHNNRFYAICYNGHAWICNISNHTLNKSYSLLVDDLFGPDGEPIICTVEGQAAEHKFMLFFIPYQSEECRLLMLSEGEEKWMYMEEEHSDSIIFLGGMFHSIAIPAANVRCLDGWDGGSICSDDPELVGTIGHLDQYTCRIVRQAIDDVESSLVSDLPDAFVEAGNHRRLLKGPSFLWLTPTFN